MSLRLGAISGSQSILRQMNQSQVELEKSLKQLASGSRLSGIGGAAASYVLSHKLQSEVDSLKSSQKNIEQALSVAQVAEAGLNEQSNILVRIREIAMQAAGDSMSDEEREQLGSEVSQLVSEFTRIAQVTSYGGHNLLSGEGEVLTFQIGATKNEADRLQLSLNTDSTAETLGLDYVSLSSPDDAFASLTDIENARQQLNGVRSQFGVFQTRLEHALNQTVDSGFALEEARSKIADVDMAEAISRYTQAQIQTKIQVAVLGQANSAADSVLKLFAT